MSFRTGMQGVCLFALSVSHICLRVDAINGAARDSVNLISVLHLGHFSVGSVIIFCSQILNLLESTGIFAGGF